MSETFGFYFINLIFVFWACFMHACFRFGIETYLRLNRKSKSFIRKHMRGYKNYWLFEEINREYPLGFWYYLNKIHLIALVVVSGVIITSGYLKFMQIPITVLSAVLVTIQVPMVYFQITTENKMEFGTPFVVFGINYNRRPPFSFILTDLLFPFVNYIFVYVNIKLVI